MEVISRAPLLREEAKALMSALRSEAMLPATQQQIRDIISQRFVLFPQPKRNDGEWAAWWADYIDPLKGLTPYAVEAGMAAWVRDPEAEFMCKPGKLAELARTTSNNNPWARAWSRADKATRVDEAPAAIAGPKPDPEQVKALMSDVVSKLAAMDPFAKARARAARPTPSAPVDDTGMSTEMRAELAEQRQSGR